jgi:HK97 family phage major capsid protein
MRRDDVRRLAEQEAGLHADLLELNGTAEKENRNLSAEEQEKFDKMMQDVSDVRERRSRAEKLLVQDREVQHTLNTPVEQRVTGAGEAGAATLSEYRKRNGYVPQEDVPEYRDAFWHHLTAQQHELDVEEQRALSKGTTTAGGFLVPTSMSNEIIRSSRDMGAIAQLCNEIRTEGGETLNLPANTVHGAASWTAESIGYTPSDETFANVSLGAFKSTSKIIVSEELVADSQFGLEQFLATEFGERLGVLQNTAFVLGDGSGKPTGLLSSATASNVTTVTAATGAGNTTTFSYTALVSAIFSLPRQYRRNAVFVVNDASARNLYLMLDSQNRPLWSVNVAENGPDTFLGYPIYTDPDLPAPAIGNISVLFGDLKRAYTVRRANGIGMQRQNELHSDNGQIGFRAYERVDGKVTLAAAAIALKHPAT